MIVTHRISIGKLLLFTWPKLLILVVFIAFACLVMETLPRGLLQALSYAAGFMGTALAFLIGFRNNAAYGRWWEGHRIWSALKYESRNFALMALNLIGGGDQTLEQRRRLVRRQIAYAWRLNHFLRKLPPDQNEQGLLDSEEQTTVEARQTPPLGVLDLQARDLRELADAGHLDSIQHTRLSESLGSFNQALSSCERLKKTPFPMQYTWFMNYTLALFLLILPLSMAGHLGYGSIPFSLMIGYAFIMLEYVGRHIENPFENAVNDVPMNYLARHIEIDLRQILGESETPQPVKPVGKGYLY